MQVSCLSFHSCWHGLCRSVTPHARTVSGTARGSCNNSFAVHFSAPLTSRSWLAASLQDQSAKRMLSNCMHTFIVVAPVAGSHLAKDKESTHVTVV